MRIGSYDVLGELGRGGMGVVYRVRAPDGRELALKLLLKVDRGTFARFERERRLLASLGEKEGFVGLLDSGSSAEGAWLLMPLAPGGTLRKKLEAGPLGVEETVALGLQLATALGAAHARGIVHRDVKPENVLFTGGPGAGRALLADLGLARHFDRLAPGGSQSMSLTAHGMVKGTAGYMAPEQLEDPRSVGPPCDVFALGLVLHECLAGRPAYQGDSLLEVFARVRSGVREPHGRRDVPAWLETTLEKALAADPRSRFPDGASLARALGARRPGPRARAPLLLGTALGALILAASLIVSSRSPTPAPARVEPAPPPAAPRPPVATERLPGGLLLAGRNVPAADGREVPLYSFRLPDGSEIEMVRVPGGDFVMGADDGDAYDEEKPRHVRRMDHGFWIGRKDVTWGQYLAFCAATGRREPSRPDWWNQVPGTKLDHPVVRVSWDDAKAYGEWAGLALPGEAEWEKAARGTDGRKWPWGNEWDPGSRCNFADASCPLDSLDAGGKSLAKAFGELGWEWDREHRDGHAFTSPVGSFPRGVSPSGALDMAGNVSQWCEDWYDARAYERLAQGDEAPASSGRARVNRGGNWSNPARGCRSSIRSGLPPGTSTTDIGFRVSLGSP